MVARSSSPAPVRFALRLLALFLLVAGPPAARAAGDPDVDAAGAFDAEANALGAGLVRGLAAAWDACGAEEPDGGAPNASTACHGLRLVRRALAQWAGGRGAVELSSGVALVPLGDAPAAAAAAAAAAGRASRKLAGAEERERGLWARVRSFLQSHELRIRLPQLLPQGDSWAAYLGGLHRQYAAGAAGVTAARGKKDKGGGAMMLMMGMMGGMMAMMGIAGTGALAMKALGVASMALMMAIAAALKKLASKDDGGGHHVSVVPVHAGGDYGHGHHRRRRDASAPDGGDAHHLAYAAYAASGAR